MIQILFSKVPKDGEFKLNDVINHISKKAARIQMGRLEAQGYKCKLWDTGGNLLSQAFRGV